MPPYHIALVDDDHDILEALNHGLSDEFKTELFTDPRDAMRFLTTNPIDAVILDYHIPGFNSFELYEDLRKTKDSHPIMFLTGESCPKIKVQGLELGVDDFLRKPMSMFELGAHIKNRIMSYRKKQPSLVELQNMKFKVGVPEISINGEKVLLTKKEFQLLSILAASPNTVVKKAEMIDAIWQDVKVEDNNLDTHLSNLRKKIKGFSGKIRTIKYFGYCLEV